MFLKTYWLLWQNARNLDYIKEYNTKFARRLADSKLKTKEFLLAKWVSVAETILVLKEHSEINDELFSNLPLPFVVKPNGGFWGKWILIFVSMTASWDYVTNTDDIYSIKDLKIHFWEILDWFYSLSWNRDKVVIEKKIELEEEVELLWKYWLPDIRVITFNMVPVMAMFRIPTEESWWKANLHSWACGVGIDIWTGKLTYITKHSKIVKQIPWIWDVRGIILPNWDNILTLAVKVQKVTNIWYLGCDIVLDKVDWPLLLEMNIRPWLEVQVANMAPLKDRLERVEGVFINSVEKWVRLWRDLFSWDIEDKIKKLSWKKVLWAREYVKILHDKKEYKYLADIKPSSTKSYIDRDFANNVLKISKEDIELSVFKFDSILLWEEKKIKFVIKELWSVNIILWLNSLRWFLIDPFKYKKWELPISEDVKLLKWKNIAIERNYKKQLKKIDSDLIWIDKKLLILKYITPNNLTIEKNKFIESKGQYIPQFEYNELKINLEELEEKLNSIEVPEIPLSEIYQRKKDDSLNKIKFLKAFRDNIANDITYYSKALYWDVDSENIIYTNNILSEKWEIKEEEEFMTIDEIKAFIKKFNHIYSINISVKTWDRTSRFAMKWDVLYVRNQACVWKKEMRSIVAHEIEGHYLRKLNWKKMEYSIFWQWTKWYLEIDEWIAIYNQNRFLWKTDKKYFGIFERYYFTNYALNKSYKKLINEMLEYYDNDYERVFTYLTRLKRWLRNASDDWIFVKDLVYVNWYLKIDNYLSKWNNLKDLYIWKINIEDLILLKDSYFLKLNYSDLKVPFFM